MEIGSIESRKSLVNFESLSLLFSKENIQSLINIGRFAIQCSECRVDDFVKLRIFSNSLT